MSQPRSRSPFYTRNANMYGRRGERFDGKPYHSDGWRGPEDVTRQEEDWENGHSKKVEQVDHWAVFIEAIGRAGKQNASSTSGYHTQGEGQSFKRSSQSPRNLHRQKMASSGASYNGAKTYQKVQSPGWSKNEHYSRDSSSRQLHGKRHDRQEAEYLNEERDDGYPNKSFNTERSQMSNFEHPPQPKRLRALDHHSDYRLMHRNSPCAPTVVEHDRGLSHHNERNKNLNPSRTRDQFVDGNPLRSREPGTDWRPPNGRNPPGGCNPGMNQGYLRNMDPLGNHDRGMNRGQSRSRDPPRSYDPDMNQRHSRSKDPSRGKDPTMNQGHPKNLDFPRSDNPVASYQHSRKWDPPNSNKFQKDRNFPRPSRERDPVKHWREFDHHSGMSHNTQSGLSYHDIGEKTSLQNSLMEGEMPLQERSQHRNYTRMNLHPRQSHRNSTSDLNRDVDLQTNDNRSSMYAQQWQKKMQTGFDNGNMQKQRTPQHKEPKSNSARGDFRGLESLMIKVDTSRPVEQSSYLGCSSERQLSVDLVNVGRQRLDFLPMLEHSGTYKETAVHSGTFAQEIITLVHHVKENYFQGQGMTLNDRFSNRQEYSLPDEEILQHPPLEHVGPIINRPFTSSSHTEIFCNTGPLQGRAQTPAPGDLRFDLERKRLQKLEGVKITIAGNSQKLSQMQENEMACGNTDNSYREEGDNRWSEDIAQQTGQWGHPSQKGPALNFNSRFNNNHFGSNTRPRGKKNFNSVGGPRW